METTFGRTVETRLIIKPFRMTNSNRHHYTNPNNGALNRRNLESSYHGGGDSGLPPTPVTKSILKRQQPQSSILMRKNYKYLFNSNEESSSFAGGPGSGYMSDSECCLIQRSPADLIDDHETNNIGRVDKDYHSRRNCFLTDNEECLNTLDMTHRSYCSSADRFRSIDRQQPKKILTGKIANSVVNKNTRLVQQLLERSNKTDQQYINQQLIARLNCNKAQNHVLMSPKTDKQARHWAAEIDDDFSQSRQVNLNNYLTWKSFNCNPSVGSNQARNNLVGKVVAKRAVQSNHDDNKCVNLRSISTPGTPLISSSSLPRKPKLNEELKIETSAETNKPRGLERKKDETKLFFLNNEYDPIAEHLNQLDILNKDIEKNSFVFNCGAGNRSRSIPNRVERMTDTSQAGMDFIMDRPPNEVISLENALLNMNEIIKKLTLIAQKKEENMKPLEKSATDSIETNLKSLQTVEPQQQISPPLSTSTSLSFSASTGVSNESNNKNGAIKNGQKKSPSKIDPALEKNISPVSCYDSTSLNTTEIRPINKSSSSFSPSESSESSTSTSSSSMMPLSGPKDRSGVLMPPNLVIASSKPKEKLTLANTNTNGNKSITNQTTVKNEGISFGKRIKRFLSISSAKGLSKR